MVSYAVELKIMGRECLIEGGMFFDNLVNGFQHLSLFPHLKRLITGQVDCHLVEYVKTVNNGLQYIVYDPIRTFGQIAEDMTHLVAVINMCPNFRRFEFHLSPADDEENAVISATLDELIPTPRLRLVPNVYPKMLRALSDKVKMLVYTLPAKGCVNTESDMERIYKRFTHITKVKIYFAVTALRFACKSYNEQFVPEPLHARTEEPAPPAASPQHNHSLAVCGIHCDQDHDLGRHG